MLIPVRFILQVRAAEAVGLCIPSDSVTLKRNGSLFVPSLADGSAAACLVSHVVDCCLVGSRWFNCFVVDIDFLYIRARCI